MKKAAIVSALVMLFMATTASAIYRWVDKNGRVHYSDVVPPQDAEQQRDVIDQHGNTREVIKAPPTAAERKAEDAARKASQDDAERKRRQHVHDTYLLSTYPNEDALISTRDERISMIQANLKQAKKAATGIDQTLADLHTQAQQFTSKKAPVPAKITEQIQQFEQQRSQVNAAIASMRTDLRNTRSRYAADLARYRELKQEQADAASDSN